MHELKNHRLKAADAGHRQQIIGSFAYAVPAKLCNGALTRQKRHVVFGAEVTEHKAGGSGAGKRRQLCALAPLDREGLGEADA